ncbi:MAG TPA: GGDEF domain-containing protein [Mycobacteriales bacterium]|jgi:diguanylate cyclase (GGDEF)-like protein|nr:GGDEF domain-containing protein [Mycobacteriales bacterium]
MALAQVLFQRMGGSGLPAVREAAAALGVLRAQQGHAVTGLVEQLLALRGVAEEAAADVATLAAIEAYVDELTAILQQQATRDPLTGLPNRAAFTEALRHEVDAAARGTAPALLLVDLDAFKAVNDTDGHLAGDAVLVAVAEVLTGAVRKGDVVARLGGDEFAIVLPRTGRRRATGVARRIVDASRTAPGLASEHARVTFSLGVAWLRDPVDPAELIAVADAALYRVKDAGGDDLGVGRTSDRAIDVPIPEQR